MKTWSEGGFREQVGNPSFWDDSPELLRLKMTVAAAEEALELESGC